MLHVFFLMRTDGKFVAHPGSEMSYSSNILEARAFHSQKEAQKNRCVESEAIVSLSVCEDRLCLTITHPAQS